MTFKNLLCVAAAAALMTSQAMAQGTGTTSSNGAGLNGPTITIDLLRNGVGNAVVNPNGGLTYVVSVTPDTDQPVFSAAGEGPNGPGASVALELGFTVGGAGLAGGTLSTTLLPVDAADPVTVNVNSSPGTGDTASEPDDGFVDFANPGNSIFGFETANLTTDDGMQIGGVQIDGNNVFAALGTTFFSASTSGPYEVLRINTGPLDSDDASTLTHSLSLVAGSIAAQSTDLSGEPLSEVFAIPEFSDSDPAVTPGDANLDGVIDVGDLSFFGGGVFNTAVAGGWGVGDFNNDGVVDVGDLSFFGNGAFNNPTVNPAPVVAASTAVPEPTSVVLVASILSLGLVARRK